MKATMGFVQKFGNKTFWNNYFCPFDFINLTGLIGKEIFTMIVKARGDSEFFSSRVPRFRSRGFAAPRPSALVTIHEEIIFLTSASARCSVINF